MLLHCRSQRLTKDANQYNIWQKVTSKKTVLAAETAIIVIDMWDRHFSRGAAERAAVIAPRMNDVITHAREKGVQILHAPAHTMEFYKDTPARLRMKQVPRLITELMRPKLVNEPPLPIDYSDGGSDTGESPQRVGTRQHEAIQIDHDVDGVSDDGVEHYNFLHHQGIKNVILMGIHANICILHRPYGMKQLFEWGFNVFLVRDLTDSLYNPARSPYVSHAEGTRLVVEYIEKFFCPTITSKSLLGTDK